MTVILELENSANWTIRDSQSFVATENVFLFEYLSVVEFTSSVIAVFVDNAEARDTWNFAGWLEQRINLPFGPGLATSAINYRKLWLKQKQLLIFPRIVPTYKIAVQFPRWFTQASITIWEYFGPQIDTVEQKLDTLLQQHPP